MAKSKSTRSRAPLRPTTAELKRRVEALGYVLEIERERGKRPMFTVSKDGMVAISALDGHPARIERWLDQREAETPIKPAASVRRAALAANADDDDDDDEVWPNFDDETPLERARADAQMAAYNIRALVGAARRLSDDDETREIEAVLKAAAAKLLALTEALDSVNFPTT